MVLFCFVEGDFRKFTKYTESDKVLLIKVNLRRIKPRQFFCLGGTRTLARWLALRCEELFDLNHSAFSLFLYDRHLWDSDMEYAVFYSGLDVVSFSVLRKYECLVEFGV